MVSKVYRVKQVLNLFAARISREALVQAEGVNIPVAERQAHGSINTRVWSTEQLPAIGERYGFLKKLNKPTVLTVFTTKGGVLKTSCAMNIARLAALHNIKTLVVGLDLQCDISSALGFYNWDQIEDIGSALADLDRTEGLGRIFKGEAKLEDVIKDTDIPTLKIIPETADLATLDRAISARNRREYWLQENIVEPLHDEFELIIFDCSPNWNQLTSNAIVACTTLISPIECQVNQFRNLRVFRELAKEFKEELKLDYTHIFIPTRFTPTRKLSAEIRGWYLTNVPGVTHQVVRESVVGEEAMAMRLSVPEYNPATIPADEMRELMKELWARLNDATATARAVA